VAGVVAVRARPARSSGQPVYTTDVTVAKSYRFDPAVVLVKAGSTVTWTNDDNFTHNVHLLGGAEFKAIR